MGPDTIPAACSSAPEDAGGDGIVIISGIIVTLSEGLGGQSAKRVKSQPKAGEIWSLGQLTLISLPLL